MNTKLLNTFAAASAVLLTLITTTSLRAGTITIVNMPATGTDAGSGINSTNNYVCAFDYGTATTAISINTVAFTHFQLAAQNTVQVTNITDTHFGGRVVLSTGGINNSKIASTSNTAGLSTRCDGSMLTLLTDCVYPGAVNQAGDWMTQECDNLKPGDNYSLRIYYRDWNNSSGDRQSSFTFDNGDGMNVATNVQEDDLFIGAHYVEYDFTAYRTNVFCTISNLFTGGPQPWLLFGSTLQDTLHPIIPFIPYAPSMAGIGNGVYQFTDQAYGDPTLVYQWYFNTVSNYSGATMAANGNDYSGSTSNILTATNNLLDYYFVVVSNNNASVTSSIVQLNPNPVITTQPTPVNVGNTYVAFSASVVGFSPLGYQWYFNTSPSYSGATGTTDGNGYSGSTTNSLQATTNLQDYYFLIVTNNYGSATSSIAAYNPYPAIATQTTPSIVGTTINFKATASGWPTLGYQWYFNTTPSYAGASISTDGVGVSGSTTTNVAITTLPNYYYYYFMVASNYYGSITSSIAQAVSPLTAVAAGEPIWNQTNPTNILVTFSDGLDPVTAATVGNYSLTPSTTISSATVVATNEVALVTTPLAGSYTLTISNVKDFLGGTVSPSSTNMTVGVYPANLALWVRADTNVTADASGNVSEWDDISGNLNELYTVSTIEPQLATNAYGDPVIRFTATNSTQMSALDSPSLRLTRDLSFIYVINKPTTAGTGTIVSKTGLASKNQPAPYDYFITGTAGLVRGNGTTSASVGTTLALTPGIPQIVAVSESGNFVTHFMNGNASAPTLLSGAFQETNCSDAGQTMNIGVRADNANKLTADISELIVAGSAISSYDVAQFDNYFMAEHHIASSSRTNIVLSASGGNLTLSWPSDHTGYRLQVQTNSLSVGIRTNWFDVSGSITTNQVIIPINTTNGSVFYRLVYP